MASGSRGSSPTTNGSDAEEDRARAVSRATAPNSTRVTNAVTVGAAAEHTEAERGDLCRTATRRHTCVCRAVARTLKSPVMHRAHGCPECDRTLTGHSLSRTRMRTSASCFYSIIAKIRDKGLGCEDVRTSRFSAHIIGAMMPTRTPAFVFMDKRVVTNSQAFKEELQSDCALSLRMS